MTSFTCRQTRWYTLRHAYAQQVVASRVPKTHLLMGLDILQVLTEAPQLHLLPGCQWLVGMSPNKPLNGLCIQAMLGQHVSSMRIVL